MATYRNDLISVDDHNENTDLQIYIYIYLETYPFFCSHSVLPTKMTYGNLIISVFWSPIAVGHSVLLTKITYGNFYFVFLESHSGWP